MSIEGASAGPSRHYQELIGQADNLIRYGLGRRRVVDGVRRLRLIKTQGTTLPPSRGATPPEATVETDILEGQVELTSEGRADA